MGLHFDSTTGSIRYSVARSDDNVGKSTGKEISPSCEMRREARTHVFAELYHTSGECIKLDEISLQFKNKSLQFRLKANDSSTSHCPVNTLTLTAYIHGMVNDNC